VNPVLVFSLALQSLYYAPFRMKGIHLRKMPTSMFSEYMRLQKYLNEVTIMQLYLSHFSDV